MRKVVPEIRSSTNRMNFIKTHCLTVPLLLRPSISTYREQPQRRVMIPYAIHPLVSGVLWNVGSQFVPDLQVLSCFDLFLDKKGVMHWSMIHVEFVPLIMKNGASSVQSFDCACSASMIERPQLLATVVLRCC